MKKSQGLEAFELWRSFGFGGDWTQREREREFF